MESLYQELKRVRKELEDLKLAYRDNDYFNDRDLFLFESNLKLFLSKVEFTGGNWYTLESMNYKASSIRSLNTLTFH